MKLVTYNTQYGVGRDGRFDLDRIASEVDGADIIALQEVTRNFARNGGVDMIEGLAALLPGYFHAFGPAMDLDFGATDGDGRPLNRRFQFGNMVLSRYPIVASRNLLLPRTLRFSRGNLQRSALEALVIAPSGPIRIYSVHLDHIAATERTLQIAHLKERALAYVSEGGAISGSAEYGFPEPPRPEAFVLMGDFNMDRFSPEYMLMVGEQDHASSGADPIDVYALGEGLPEGAVSWIDDAGPQDNRLIDFAFVERSLAGRVGKIRIDRDAKGSDHLPVWFDLE
ncbi:MAG TPA: endonuclease/exonuclease/phosphatase family protein [Rhizobiaceae bacterium]